MYQTSRRIILIFFKLRMLLGIVLAREVWSERIYYTEKNLDSRFHDPVRIRAGFTGIRFPAYSYMSLALAFFIAVERLITYPSSIPL